MVLSPRMVFSYGFFTSCGLLAPAVLFASYLFSLCLAAVVDLA